jgi:hypothetical protein
MGLLTQNAQQYYSGKKEFTGDGTTTIFKVSDSIGTFPTGTTALTHPVKVYINGTLIQGGFGGGLNHQYWFRWTALEKWHIDFSLGLYPYGAPASNDTIIFEYNNFGNYQFISLENIIDNFMATYIGEDKILTNTKRSDVSFHAHRALAELSFDTFKSTKSQEIEVPASLTMILPHDYVNYIKLTWSDSSGIKHTIYPAKSTSNPFNPKQKADGTFDFVINSLPLGDEDTTDLIPEEKSDTLTSYQSTSPSGNNNDDYQNDTYWLAGGERYGLDPQYAQVNGVFFINDAKGLIHFSSNILGKTVVLDYISDSLGEDDEMQVHKLAEEAIYKHIVYGCVNAKLNIPEYIVNRFKRERFAETRKAKLRLSNIKIEEITQILRGKSKQIKH